MVIARATLTAFFDALLKPASFPDYGPNGLQIEGAERIERAAFAVSATVESAERAIAGGADALVVHHGLFWTFHGARPLTGPFARRVLPLVRHGVNLYAFHLPLDAHPDVGNAATLGRALGLIEQQPFGDYQGVPTGVQGRLPDAPNASELRARLVALLGRDVWLASPDEEALVRSLGIITGGANREWKRALAAGLDAYLTGEMSEHDWHEAREAGLHMYAGGHHATERFGVQALMTRVECELGLECFFIDSDNPS